CSHVHREYADFPNICNFVTPSRKLCIIDDAIEARSGRTGGVHRSLEGGDFYVVHVGLLGSVWVYTRPCECENKGFCDIGIWRRAILRRELWRSLAARAAQYQHLLAFYGV